MQLQNPPVLNLPQELKQEHCLPIYLFHFKRFNRYIIPLNSSLNAIAEPARLESL